MAFIPVRMLFILDHLTGIEISYSETKRLEPVPYVIVRNGRASVYGNGMR